MIIPTLDEEKGLWQKGFKYVCGVDEAGRGPLAGPVVAAAVVFPQNSKRINGVRDSKQVTPKARKILVERIKTKAIAFAYGVAEVSIIENKGIVQATCFAMWQAISKLGIKPDFHLVDGFFVPFLNENIQKGIKRGDENIFSISAASILAKVYRDSLMKEYHNQYPEYQFEQHKGYGTKKHKQAIREFGLCEIHRRSFVHL